MNAALVIVAVVLSSCNAQDDLEHCTTDDCSETGAMPWEGDLDHPGYILITNIEINGLTEAAGAPVVRFSIGNSKQQSTKKGKKGRSHKFDDQLYFAADKLGPEPKVSVDVDKTNWWGSSPPKFLSSDIGEVSCLIRKDGGGRVEGLALDNDLKSTVSFNWIQSMNKKGFKDMLSPEILDGVNVPLTLGKRVSNLIKLNFAEVSQVLGKLLTSKIPLDKIKGTPKFTKDGSNSLQAMIDYDLPYTLNGGVTEDFDAQMKMWPVKDYKFYGTQDNWGKTLSLLCKCNPFFRQRLDVQQSGRHLPLDSIWRRRRKHWIVLPMHANYVG